MSGFYLKILQNWIPFGGLSGHLWTGRFLSSLPKSPSRGMGSPTQPAHISIKITGLPSGAFGFEAIPEHWRLVFFCFISSSQ